MAAGLFYLRDKVDFGGKANEQQDSEMLNTLLRRVGALEDKLLQQQQAPPAQSQVDSTTIDSQPPSHMLERIDHIEEKFNGMLNWVGDTNEWCVVSANCTKKLCALENGPMTLFNGPGHLRVEKKGQWEQCLCADNTPWEVNQPAVPKDQAACIVYDYGIRREPDFGVQFARAGCHVYAFDPSPTTKKYMEGDFKNEYQAVWAQVEPNYHFRQLGGGGKNGEGILYGYNWDQVSRLLIAYTVY
jgi:hypothetical protein